MQLKLITAKGEFLVNYEKNPYMENIYDDVCFGNIKQKVIRGSVWTDFEIISNEKIFTNFSFVYEHKFIIFVYKEENCFFIDENFHLKKEEVKANWNEDSSEISGLTFNYTIGFSNPSIFNLDSLDLKGLKNKKEIGNILKKYLVKTRLKNYENN